MSEEPNSSDDIVIRIPRSVVLGKESEASNTSFDESPPRLNDGSQSHKKIGIGNVTAERNSFHGLTDIKTLSFGEGLDPDLLMYMLDNPSLIAKTPGLFEIICELGHSTEFEHRLFASRAVKKLTVSQTFVDLRSNIIDIWARSPDLDIRKNAARSLLYLLESQGESNDLEDGEGQETSTDEENNIPQEVLRLLHHWNTVDSPNLSDTALITYAHMARTHPFEVLRGIQIALDKADIQLIQLGRLLKMLRVIPMIDRVYTLYPQIVIEHLYLWLTNLDFPLRRDVAGILFLSLVRFDDVVDKAADSLSSTELDDTHTEVVEMVISLWNTSALSEQMTDKLYHWALMALKESTQEDFKKHNPFLIFFYALHREYENRRTNRFGEYDKKRKNRLDLAIKRWQRRAKLEQSKSERRNRRDTSVSIFKAPDFSILIPQTPNADI